MYRPSTDFVDRSNKRADKQERRWCLKHPISFWGKDQWGNWYTRCSVGNKVNEDCEIGKEDLEK